MVFIKTAIAAVLLCLVISNVTGIEQNDDLVFDADGKSHHNIPIIDHNDETFFGRVKRGIFDWFQPITTTTTTPVPETTTTEQPAQFVETTTHHRGARESGEELDKLTDEDNDIGEAAESNRRNDYEGDDEDYHAGSGEVEGSAFDHPGFVEPSGGQQARFYRITITVQEPYIGEYADPSSNNYLSLSRNLTHAVDDLLSQRIPGYDHVANVVKISPTNDPFTSEVLMDIGSTVPHEQQVRDILEEQLQYHALGDIQVSPDHFTFRSFSECPVNTHLKCRDGTCVPLTARCDGIPQCPDDSDELDCPASTTEEPTPTTTSVTYEPETEVPTRTLLNNDTDESRILSPGSSGNNCRGDDAVPCRDGSRVICSVQECDGVPDCDDGGDEQGCPTSCGSGEFACDVSRCILDRQRCDFTQDCDDGSDERNCDYPACSQSEYRCRNGQCIDNSLRCNGYADCRDRSDETNCRQCGPDEFDCGGGYCISSTARCDGRSDCPDRSDERNCTVTTCSSDQYRCLDGTCVGIDKRCNGVPDCRSGEDEHQCETPYCPDGQAPCANGVCIPKEFFCDRNPDCLDGSDERDCPNSTTYPQPRTCRSDEFTCNDYRCIPRSSVCDGRPDCTGSEDEANCNRGCASGQFQCRNGDCISESQKCNNVYDCDDGSDEEGCEVTTTPSSRQCRPTEFTCADRTCVHYSSRCNGIPECRDRSDEEGCDTEKVEGLNLVTYPSEQIIKETPANQAREVVFQCRDEGNLRARVRWLRGNNLPLPPGARDINGRLEIPDIKMEHSGTYICEAVDYPSSVPGQRVSVHLEVEKFELPATRPPQYCKYDEATCNSGDCIPKSFVCDGKFDCSDGSDEMRCNPHGCEPNQFRCNNKQCVSKIWRCDGDNDCHDGSDEENCGAPPPGSICRAHEYQCQSNNQCIPRSYQCDMERDCLDGSDEIGCSPVYIIKPPPPMVQLMPGETMVLTCTAIGVPTPEINWRLNWGHVPPKCTSTSVNGTGTLTCPDISIQDQGAYSCEGINVGGFVFAVPDAILIVKKDQDVCPRGTFNSEAQRPEDCISCFCFGVTDECRSANLFSYQIPPPFDRHRALNLDISGQSGPRLAGELTSFDAEIRPQGRDGVEIVVPRSESVPAVLKSGFEVPYFALPEAYHGSRLLSYGGYLRYTVRYSGDGRNNSAPSVVLMGNGRTLIHRGRYIPPDVETEESVRFFYGDWYKVEYGREIPATREDIMMTLAHVENILIKAKYENSPQMDVSITDIAMDSAHESNTGGGSASFVEECSCPTGYTGYSCEDCASGYRRRSGGRWLGECYRDEPPCPPGYYGDPSRNIECKLCPCPHTNPSNQFSRTCRLGPNRQPICDCPPGYVGERCEKCAEGWHGNPLIPGDMCIQKSTCDPRGALSATAEDDGKCRCKQYATGLTCDQCKPNTFNLASSNQFGCISCFCMGITNRCAASNWYRNEIHVSFTNSIRDFALIDALKPEALPFTDGIRLDTNRREIIYRDFPNRGNGDVYYWQLPSIFLGDRVSSYGGNLKYTIRHVPSPGGQSSRNNAADVELSSLNDIKLYYFSRESPEPNSQQSFTVPLLEQYWQRSDGTQVDREHLLMALADVQAIRIKATYTTHTDEAALSSVSLDTAEKWNTGRERAVEVEECSCPAGYTGLSCEDCAPGYTRGIEGLYLGICEPCNCNGHSTQCDPDTGVCENCANHTTGENCDVCEPGYVGDPTREGCRWAGEPPVTCDCDPAGSVSSLCIGGRCECKSNVEGARCNRCRPATFGLSADNVNGCNQCFCSGVTDQCHESSMYIQQIPSLVYDNRHGFTLTDASRLDVLDDTFDINVAENEIGYQYTAANKNKRLFWSLPATFTGNQVKSYGGNLTMTQRYTAQRGAQPLVDQDVMLLGNGISLFWTNSHTVYPNRPITYSVPLRESEWRRLSVEGPRSASRTDLMTVLSNLEAILVRATYSEGMISTHISDISLDTAVEHFTGKPRATQIESCQCPLGYSGSSCESCSRGYYRDITNRSVSILGSCNACPCNDHEESCEMSRVGLIKCHCLAGYTGQYCQDTVDGPPVTTIPPPTIAPPRIVVSVQENKFQIVHVGSTVRYHCSGTSLDNNQVRIRWEKEGSRLSSNSLDDSRGLLLIRDVSVSDSGVYICRVTDGINVGVAKVTLTVGGSTRAEPKATIHPNYQQIKEGEPVEFQCQASGSPSPSLEWIRVGGQMNPEATFYNGVWRIPAVSRSDEAEYKCIARNELGVDERTTILYVLDNPNRPPPNRYPDAGPTITPQEWVGNSGDTVRMVCTRLSSHAAVHWVRSGGLALPASATQQDGVLTIDNPGPTDSGVYICIATSNKGTESSSSSRITIHPRRHPTAIKIEPERQTVSQNTEAELKCLVNNQVPDVKVEWSKYGETSLGPRAQVYGNTLKINRPQVSDRGVYVCRITTPSGVRESSAIVEVSPREAPIIEVYPKNLQPVILGGSADLQCRVTAGYPTPEVHWARQDGRPFASNVVQLPGGLLRLINITLNDGGSYQCTASNEVAMTSAVVQMEVQAPPVIVIRPNSGIVRVRQGDRVRLECTAQGHPQPHVSWSRHHGGYPDYTSISAAQSIQLSAVHEIQSMSLNDEGSYTCQASNAAGTVEERVQVRIEDEDNNVEYPPCRGDQPCPQPDGSNRPYLPPNTGSGVQIPDDSLRIPIGGRVEMRCQLLGPQPAYLDWRRVNGQKLPPGSTVQSGVLTIPEVTREAAGDYMCLGLDNSGAELFRAKSHLEIISPPRIDLNPSRQTVEPGESPSIICSATGDQPLNIEWSAIGRPMPPSVTADRGMLRFRGITYNDAGKYACKATNPAGTAEAVAEVIVNSDNYHEGIRAVERDVNEVAGTSIKLRCDTNERVQIDWIREGQSLPRNSYAQNNHLIIERARPEDSGRYICQITDHKGAVSSDYVNVRVSPPAGPVVQLEPSSDIVNIGDTFDLRCIFSSRQPGSPRYRWYRAEDGSLPPSAQVYEDRLRIVNVQMTDSGVYKCRVDTAEGNFEQDYNLIVQGHENDEPAIEMKSLAYGTSTDLYCRTDFEEPIAYEWTKLHGRVPDVYRNSSTLSLSRVRAADAGTYICKATHGLQTVEIPTVVVVTGVVPHFSQAPRSFIALKPLPDSYFRFNIEVSFKPESYDGVILYTTQFPDSTGDYVILALDDGYPEFGMDIGSGPLRIRAEKPVTLGEWHTIKLQRAYKETLMLVDNEGPYKGVSPGKKRGLDVNQPVYVGGVPDHVEFHPDVHTNRVGFVGCVSRLLIQESVVDLIGNQTDSVGVTTCETCAENPCHNSGYCQEAPTKEGYTCLCRAGFTGEHCDNNGQACSPGICGEGNCVDTENGYKCHCPQGTFGRHCEHTGDIHQPAFRNARSYVAYNSPDRTMRRSKLSDVLKKKRSHHYLAQLRKSRSSHPNKHHNHHKH